MLHANVVHTINLPNIIMILDLSLDIFLDDNLFFVHISTITLMDVLELCILSLKVSKTWDTNSNTSKASNASSMRPSSSFPIQYIHISIMLPKL